MKIKITALILAACLAVAAPAAAQTCTPRTALAGLAIIKGIDRQIKSCEHAAKTYRGNVAYACRKCGPLVSTILRFDGWSKKNQGCFVGNQAQYVLRSLSHYRKKLRDFKRLCRS